MPPQFSEQPIFVPSPVDPGFNPIFDIPGNRLTPFNERAPFPGEFIPVGSVGPAPIGQVGLPLERRDPFAPLSFDPQQQQAPAPPPAQPTPFDPSQALGSTLRLLVLLCNMGVLPPSLCSFTRRRVAQQNLNIQISGVTSLAASRGVGGVARAPTAPPARGGGGSTVPNIFNPVTLLDVLGGETPFDVGLTRVPTGGLTLPGGAPAPSGLGQMFGSLRFEGNGACPPARARMASLVPVQNPCTGTMTFYRHVGKPVLFSGDVGLCKRVKKIAAKAGRVSGGRR